jgi:hypothetical protein
MGLFGTQSVRILGPLTIDGKRLTCPVCDDDGQQIGHTITASGEKDLATVTCGANGGHQFAFDGLTIASANKIPRKGRFELKLGGHTFAGIAARPSKGDKDKPTSKGGSGSALAKGSKPPALGSKAKGSAGGGLGSVLVASLNTVSALAGTATATVGAVGQIAGAAGQGARAVGEVAKVGNNAVSLARDGVGIAASNAAAHNALQMAQHQAAQEQAQREHERSMPRPVRARSTRKSSTPKSAL